MMPVKKIRCPAPVCAGSAARSDLFLAVEQQLPLNGQNGASDTMLRASASFFNGGKYSDEWHPNGSGWFAQNLHPRCGAICPRGYSGVDGRLSRKLASEGGERTDY